MLHFYDSSPYSIDTQRRRLKPACALSDAHIKCLVWGEDALAYIHFIPTNLFDLHLVVQDADFQRASTQLTQSLPYKISSPIPDNHLEHICFDASQPRAFTHSVLLEMTVPDGERHMDDSYMVYIHPQSQLYLDINDTSRSVSLPPFPDTLRFPTRTAFLDSMIELFLDPPSGRMHSRRDTKLRSWISYFLTYTLRNEPRELPNGELEPEHAEVVRSLKPENQSYFDNYARFRTPDRSASAKDRKAVLEKLGRHEEARRPLIESIRLDPEFMAQRLAKRKLEEEQKLANQMRPYSTLALGRSMSTFNRFIRLIR